MAKALVITDVEWAAAAPADERRSLLVSWLEGKHAVQVARRRAEVEVAG